MLVAVHSLFLVLSDDGVLQSTTGLYDEYGRVLLTLSARTLDVRALVRLHLAVENLASLDHVRRAVQDGALASGPRAIRNRPGRLGGLGRLGRLDRLGRLGRLGSFTVDIVISGGRNLRQRRLDRGMLWLLVGLFVVFRPKRRRGISLVTALVLLDRSLLE